MGYRIRYAMHDGMLQAAVSGGALGRSTASYADWIARDIATQAGQQTASRVLIDLRGLADRLGFLGSLSMARNERNGGYHVAVVDTMDNDAYYALHEVAALARGCVLRCFTSVADAARWLRSTSSQD